MRTHGGLKPQDVVLLLKMFLWEDRSWRLIDIAQELGLSQGEISFALQRLKKSKLIDYDKKKPLIAPMLEFLIHGVKYMFPVDPGPISRGIPTSHSAPPLVKKIVVDENDQYVWAFAEGKIRGQSIEPLYSEVPFAVMKDPKLHELLALVDALRVGRARERNLATTELQKRMEAI